ncbi:GNAT family N-acetyltransferase [Parashewanella curva]|uniref:GNAT family N-acetyltransferase n=1 Tax=Parashewanella curva TaxID=2338552 RepID=A0A3L8PUK3_9GAMM|nr:GNAT family N-acetyltransferase [Parashewanella curva]RLV58996.1 GNAT family N-acetyltransferase [Parashewanella curva]
MYQITHIQTEQLTPEQLEDILEISRQISELDNGVTAEKIQQRLQDKAYLVSIAYVEGEPAGYKIGYALSNEQFYSWLGGVAKDYRNLGVAQQLLDAQEQWVQTKGYGVLKVKTMNQFKGMLCMLINNDYQLMGIESPVTDNLSSKIQLEKHFDSVCG